MTVVAAPQVVTRCPSEWWPTEAHAKAAANRRNGRSAEVQVAAYVCPQCGLWHLREIGAGEPQPVARTVDPELLAKVRGLWADSEFNVDEEVTGWLGPDHRQRGIGYRDALKEVVELLEGWGR